MAQALADLHCDLLGKPRCKNVADTEENLGYYKRKVDSIAYGRRLGLFLAADYVKIPRPWWDVFGCSRRFKPKDNPDWHNAVWGR